ncbi:PPE domain-containing protein [Amycolatopsis sp. NPDC003676]
MAGRSLTPAEIYRQVTGGQGPESLGETQKAAEGLSQSLLERVDEIARIAEKVRAGWHGATAEEAANSAAPLMAAAAAISTNLVFVQNAADGQLSAFQTVKNTVKPVGDRPELTVQDVYDSLSGKPGYFGKLGQWQADAQHNVDAYTGYHATTATNSDHIPARYAELSDTGASVDLASASTPRKPVTRPGKPSGKPPDGRHRGVIEPPSDVKRPAPEPVGSVPKPREPLPEAASDRPESHPGSHRPEATESRPSAVPPEATRPPDSTRISSYHLSSPALPPGYQFGPSGQPINPLGPNGFEGLGSGCVDTGPGGSAEGGLGEGNRVGARAPVESVPTRGSTTGNPGTAGKPGNLVGSGIPGKNRETDKEKTAPPYLRETDPDVFGTSDLKPTPPVIGDRPAR